MTFDHIVHITVWYRSKTVLLLFTFYQACSIKLTEQLLVTYINLDDLALYAQCGYNLQAWFTEMLKFAQSITSCLIDLGAIHVIGCEQEQCCL